MGLLTKLNESRFFKNLVYYPLVTGIISLSSCTEGSSPSSSNNPGGGNGGGNGGGYVSDEGSTNDEGELELEVNGVSFDIYVKNDNGNSLGNIDVKGVDFTNHGNKIYGFLARDDNGNYFPDVTYVDLNSTSSIDEADAIRINHILNEIRGRKYEKKEHNENEPAPYSFSDNPRLNYLGTVTLDDLFDFYNEYDAITKNINILEFSAELSGRPELSFAVESAKFRNYFLENVSAYNDVMNSIAQFFGGSFEKEAYYLDIYQNNLGILTHESSQKDLSTLKGIVWGQGGDEIEGTLVQTISGPVNASSFTNNNGLYFLKYLNEGDYIVRASASDYQSGEKSKWIIRSDYHYPECKELNFVLDLSNEKALDTLILQPGPNEGKDTFLQRISSSEGGNYNYISGPDDETLWCGFDRDWSVTSVKRIFLEFVQLPLNLDVESAKFSFYGWPINNETVSFRIYALSNRWDENMDWSNQPSLNTNLYKDVTVRRNLRVMTEVDITDIVSEWSNNSNNGLIIKLVTEDGYGGDYQMQFYSSDNSYSSLRPMLKVVYNL